MEQSMEVNHQIKSSEDITWGSLMKQIDVIFRGDKRGKGIGNMMNYEQKV